jgi:fumarylacetoacetase
MIEANNPKHKSWVEVSQTSDFPIQNLPFGVAGKPGEKPWIAVRIGDHALNLQATAQNGLLNDLGIGKDVFDAQRLNPLLALGKKPSRQLRNRISELLREENTSLRNHANRTEMLFPVTELVMHMPVDVGDYTDFYSSEQHATNVGTMFRDPNNALLPNWKHIPVGYHGRSSSIILSGESIVRPKGQTKADDADAPTFGPTRLLDFELEMAFVTYSGKPLGDTISTAEAEDYIFGMVLFNDWSARDIQKWEYVPLGPFLAKNFASSISPWIVTLDALEPFRVPGPVQDPKVLPYLEYQGDKHIDINLEVGIIPENGDENVVGRTNYKHMYWNMNQQLAHHTVNGCNVRAGDMMASGTISGNSPESYGSMLEISWRGTKPVTLSDGSERKFIMDHDTVVMKGHAEKNGIRIGFGEVRTKVLPAR